MKILVVTPAFNVEKTITVHLENLLHYFKPKNILVVNDGSTDSTAEKVNFFSINMISLLRNWGKGFALQQALLYAKEHKYDAIITIDSDLQHDHKIIKQFKSEFKSKSDFIIGSRSFSSKEMPFLRKVSNFMSSFILSLITWQWISDSQSGFRMIGSNYFNIFSSEHGFQYESDFLVHACWQGAKIKKIEIPTIYNDSKSAFRYMWDSVNFIRLFVTLTIKRFSR